MKEKGWIIAVFSFVYKRESYFVIVERFTNRASRPEYMLCKLTFRKKSNINCKLEMNANSERLDIDAKSLRVYFGIAYVANLGKILRQFTRFLGRSVPKEFNVPVDSESRAVMVDALSGGDSEDPSKLYCFKIRRNPLRKDGGPSLRSDFNDNKARLLHPGLYQIFKDDKTVSFCFTNDRNKERSDELILESFSGVWPQVVGGINSKQA